MTKQEKVEIIQSLLEEGCVSKFYEALENIGDLKGNYFDYMTTKRKR